MKSRNSLRKKDSQSSRKKVSLSRSRKKVWHKGEISGFVQVVKEKFQSTRVEVIFPSSDLETRRRNKIWLFVKDIRIVSKG